MRKYLIVIFLILFGTTCSAQTSQNPATVYNAITNTNYIGLPSPFPITGTEGLEGCNTVFNSGDGFNVNYLQATDFHMTNTGCTGNGCTGTGDKSNWELPGGGPADTNPWDLSDTRIAFLTGGGATGYLEFNPTTFSITACVIPNVGALTSASFLQPYIYYGIVKVANSNGGYSWWLAEDNTTTMTEAGVTQTNLVNLGTACDPALSYVTSNAVSGLFVQSKFGDQVFGVNLSVGGIDQGSGSRLIVYDNTTSTCYELVTGGPNTSGMITPPPGSGTLSVPSSGTTLTWVGGSQFSTYWGCTSDQSVTAATWSGGVATFSVAGQQPVGNSVVITGSSPSAWNGTYTVASSSSGSFTASVATNPGTYVSGGTLNCPTYSVGTDYMININGTLYRLGSATGSTPCTATSCQIQTAFSGSACATSCSYTVYTDLTTAGQIFINGVLQSYTWVQTCTSCNTSSDWSFGIHDERLFKGGNYIEFTNNGVTGEHAPTLSDGAQIAYVLWQYKGDTLAMAFEDEAIDCSDGHNHPGVNMIANVSTCGTGIGPQPSGYQGFIGSAPLTPQTQFLANGWNPSLSGYIGSNHGGWPNDNQTDTAPIIFTFPGCVNPTTGAIDPSGCSTSDGADSQNCTTKPNPSAMFCEIVGIGQNGPSGGFAPIYRFANTLNSALNGEPFSGQYGGGLASQDGKYFIFPSDMEGNLGSTTGASTCTLSATSSYDCNVDLFILALPVAAATIPTAPTPGAKIGELLSETFIPF